MKNYPDKNLTIDIQFTPKHCDYPDLKGMFIISVILNNVMTFTHQKMLMLTSVMRQLSHNKEKIDLYFFPEID